MSRLILTLGMHRSGTSVVARSLECLGAELGPRASWSGHDNPDFAEDMDILNINELLLEQAGAKWHSAKVPPIMGFFRRLDQTGWLVATELLRIKTRRHPILALKEPRICRLLPFWRPVFETIGCDMSVVEVVRHPLAVAHSLKARNDLPIAAGLALWLDHVRCYLRDRDPAWPWVTVLYDQFLEYPARQIMRIGRTLNLVVTNLDPLIRPDLRHHVITDAPLPPDVDAAWQAALERANA